jgi:type IV secretory pathway VirB6-like protein
MCFIIHICVKIHNAINLLKKVAVQRLKFFLLTIFCLFSQIEHSYCQMANVFSDCNLPNSGQNDSKKENIPNEIKSSTFSFIYDNYCSNICNDSFSWKSPNTNSELNSDFILQCKNICRSKIKSDKDFYYVSSKRTVFPFSITKNNPDPTKNAVVVNYSIYSYQNPQKPPFDSKENSVDNSAMYFNTQLKNDSITTLTLDFSKENLIYACGHKIIKMEPIFPNMFLMSPDTVSGGNAEEILVTTDNTSGNTKTSILLNDRRFSAHTDFDYDGYIKNFGYEHPQSLEEILGMVFCDLYKQNIAINGGQFNCKNEIEKYGLVQVDCKNCKQPTEEEMLSAKVRAGKISVDECKKEFITRILGRTIDSIDNLFADYSNVSQPLSNPEIEKIKKYCEVQQYKIPEELKDILKFYSKISKVKRDDVSFFRSTWSKSNSTDDNDVAWNSTSRTYHPCLSTTPNKLESNETLTQSTKTNYDPSNFEISIDNYPERVGCYPSWHIYNTSYTDTGIKVSDRDFLAIKWGGNFIFGNGLNLPFFDQSGAKMITIEPNSLLRNFSTSRIVKKLKDTRVLNMMSRIDFEGLNPLVGEDGAIPVKTSSDSPPEGLEGEICRGNTIYDLLTQKPAEWYGLKGRINRGAGFYSPKPGGINIKSFFPCEQTNIKGDTYSFQGNLSGIGEDKPLKIRFTGPKDENESAIYENSIITGGHQVYIEWGGCPMKDGEGIEIALGNSDDNNQVSLNWEKISTDQIKNGYTLAPQNKGVSQVNKLFDASKFNTIFLRVNTNQHAKKNVDDLNDNFPDGSYNVKIQTVQIKTPDENTEFHSQFDITQQIAIGVFSNLIGDISFINDPSKNFDGVLVKFATQLPQSFSDIIKVVLVLYIAITGIGFMMGTVKMSQQELIGRIFKISIVIIVLSETTWGWFIQNYIRLFIVGSLKLASLFQDLIKRVLDNQYVTANDVFDLFSVWKLFFYVIQKTFTFRLLALGFSSLVGFVIALVIIAGVVVAFKVIIESIFVYISAIVTQGLLLIIAPFFFVLKLFETTKDLFDNWAKQVIAFSIIPSAVTIAINMFLLLLIIGLDATMNFSYCTGCMIEIFGYCLIPAFYTLGLLFFPPNGASDFLLPSGLVSGALAFIIIVHTGYHVVSLAVGMITRIITFRFETLGKESMTGLSSNLLQTGARTFAETKGLISDASTKKAINREKKIGEIGKKIDKIKRD